MPVIPDPSFIWSLRNSRIPSYISVGEESDQTAATCGSWPPATIALTDPNENPSRPMRAAGTPCARTQSQPPRTSMYSSLPPANRASSPSESPWSRMSIRNTE